VGEKVPSGQVKLTSRAKTVALAEVLTRREPIEATVDTLGISKSLTSMVLPIRTPLSVVSTIITPAAPYF
jgi:hypothetical protein